MPSARRGGGVVYIGANKNIAIFVLEGITTKEITALVNPISYNAPVDSCDWTIASNPPINEPSSPCSTLNTPEVDFMRCVQQTYCTSSDDCCIGFQCVKHPVAHPKVLFGPASLFLSTCMDKISTEPQKRGPRPAIVKGLKTPSPKLLNKRAWFTN
ncbi:MAG: hypothetical protein M1827_000357 [Pycnora praestabilis]|nr:MAG: hypothetical protein M1827_000357 [Pycnora praestabilis]